jgi:hypothetical protein
METQFRTDGKESPIERPAWGDPTESAASSTSNPNQLANRSFGQLWGLHPAVTGTVFVIDTMLFGAQIATLGTLFPLALAVGAVLGFITYRAQMRWYHDDAQSASIKALVVALVTAIPSPLPAFLYVPAGLLGVVHTLRGKK